MVRRLIAKLSTRGCLYQPMHEVPKLIYSPRVNIFAINLLTIYYTLYCMAILNPRESVKALFVSQGK